MHQQKCQTWGRSTFLNLGCVWGCTLCLYRALGGNTAASHSEAFTAQDTSLKEGRKKLHTSMILPRANNCKLYEMLSERFVLMFYSFIAWMLGLWEAVPVWRESSSGIKIPKTQTRCWGGSLGSVSNTVRGTLNLLMLVSIKLRKLTEEVEVDCATHLKITIYKPALLMCTEQRENLIEFGLRVETSYKRNLRKFP